MLRDLNQLAPSGRRIFDELTLATQSGPAFTGAPIANQSGTAGAAFPAINAGALFTGSGLTFSKTGTWPSGVTLNTASGLLGGTYSPAGTYSASVTATNVDGSAPSNTFTITVSAGAPPPPPPPPPPAPAPAPAPWVNPAYGAAWLSTAPAGGGGFGGGGTVRRRTRGNYDGEGLDLSDLPDELQDGAAQPDAAEETDSVFGRLDPERLLALGQTIAALRDEAIKARAESGIEQVWMACEEAYLCIDSLNRHEFAKARWAKPVSMDGPLVAEARAPLDGRSTVFVRLTARYVDMGAAKVSEILLPIDDKAFSIDPTPVPALVNRRDDPRPAPPALAAAALTPPAMGQPPGAPPGAMPPPGAAPAGLPGLPAVPGAPPPTVGDVAKAVMTRAQQAAEKAEQRIYDWMVEANYPAQMRKVVHDAARLGVGVLKGPFPETREAMSLARDSDIARIAIERTVAPSCRWIDPWNLFPHPACGEDIHDGDHIFERDFVSAKTLREMKDERDSTGAPLYLDAQIDRVLKEGPGKINEEGRNPNEPKNKNRFDVWYFYGTLVRDELQAAGAIGLDDLPDELAQAYAIVTLVNDSVVRCTINPLDSGRFPFNVMPWSRRAGSWAGVGVAEQVATPQKMVNAGTRAVFNNAGVSAGVQIVLDPLAIVPADGSRVLTPNKLWYKTADSALDDVRKAFMAVEFPNITAQLMPIVQYAFKLAEEASNIPLISQGQDGPTTPQTFGAAELQNHNANTLLRQIAYSFDDHITEPLVTGLYEWLLLDPDVPEEEKGDFRINAKGSISMVEKAIQEQTLVQMGAMVVNPAFGADPAKWFEEVLKAKRMDPRRILMSDEDKARRAQMPPPEAPQIAAAKLRAQADAQMLQMRLQFEQGAEQFKAQVRHQAEQAAAQLQMQIAQGGNQARLQAAQMTSDATVQKMRVDQDRDREHLLAETQRTTNQYQVRIAELQQKERLEMLRYANLHQLKLEDVKSSLAKAALEINATKELAAVEAPADKLPKPPIEPPQQARPGHSFNE